MRKSLAAAVMAMVALVAADRAFAQEHLVTTTEAQARLAEAEAGRQHDLAVLDGVLSTPEAVAAAKAVGADLDGVRRAASTLSDSELRDLAARAAAAENDPVAGASDSDLRWLLYIFLLVAIVILVLKAVD
jgi:hypothetical protein